MLVDNWKQAWRMLSVWATGITGLLAAADQYLPMLHQYLPDGWVKWAALAIIVSRLIGQPGLHSDAAK